MSTITLNDGTKITGLTFSHNIFWSETPVDPKTLRGKLNPVTITSDNNSEEYDIDGTHEHMELCYCKMMEGKYALALNDIPKDKWDREKLRADVDYAIMLGGGSF